MSFQSFTDAVWALDDYVWYVPFALIIALGIYCTVKYRGIQILQLGEMCRVTFSFKRKSKDEITPFHVFCVSMGNRIGIGNIAGPITAIVTGGPGAILWMWVFATLGGATSFMETTVGQIFKSRNEDGSFTGGPAYNVSKGLGSRRLGVLIAALMIAVYIGGFILSEISTISTSFTSAYDFEYNGLVIAFILSMFGVVVAMGGFARVARISVVVIPFMAFAWVAMCSAVILMHAGNIPGAVSSIFRCAFDVPSVVGGGIGAMLTIALKRGIWSNEAGEGTITNISSSADVEHPARQGLSQSVGVLFDTLISTMTAMVILTYADFDSIMALDFEGSMDLLGQVLSESLGGIAPTLVFFFMFLFAITCFMGDYVIGENNLKLITKDPRARMCLVAATVGVVFFSAYCGSDGLYAVMDVLLAVCGVANCLVMMRLGRFAHEAYLDYRRQKAEGIEDPVFRRSVLSDPSGVTEWGDRRGPGAPPPGPPRARPQVTVK